MGVFRRCCCARRESELPGRLSDGVPLRDGTGTTELLLVLVLIDMEGFAGLILLVFKFLERFIAAQTTSSASCKRGFGTAKVLVGVHKQIDADVSGTTSQGKLVVNVGWSVGV